MDFDSASHGLSIFGMRAYMGENRRVFDKVCAAIDNTKGITRAINQGWNGQAADNFILENVKGLTNHDKGNTLKTITKLLEEAGYRLYYKVLNSLDYGVPQMRERIYFVGIRNDKLKREFKWPEKIKTKSIKTFLCDEDTEILPVDNKTFVKYLNNKYNKVNNK